MTNKIKTIPIKTYLQNKNIAFKESNAELISSLIKPLEIIKTGLEKQSHENARLEPLYFLQPKQKTAQQRTAFSRRSG